MNGFSRKGGSFGNKETVVTRLCSYFAVEDSSSLIQWGLEYVK